MANVTKAQLLDLVAQLERNAEDDRRRIGVMMYEANVMTQRIVELEAEVSKLEDSVEAYQDRCDTLEAMVAKPNAPVREARKLAPVSTEVELAPVVNITDADKAIWSKFQRLSREERMTIINWARPKFGHIGMHNIQAVRAAWHEFHNPASCADEANLADIA